MPFNITVKNKYFFLIRYNKFIYVINFSVLIYVKGRKKSLLKYSKICTMTKNNIPYFKIKQQENKDR